MLLPCVGKMLSHGRLTCLKGTFKMKRFLALLLALVFAFSLVSCQRKEPKKAAPADGKYNIEVESSTSMFRIVKCVLTVEGDRMTADMTMSGQGYGFVYMGKVDDAPAKPDENNAIPFTLDADGAKVFTVPVSALDTAIDCAAWSVRKETWYDHELIFKSENMTEAKTYADGSYTCSVTLSGGTGRASIESPASVEIKNGKAVATVIWSSSHYEYVKIGETQFDPVNTEGNSTFEIPVSFDTDIEISALTNAMSEPHLIDYVLRFDSATLKQK